MYFKLIVDWLSLRKISFIWLL